MSEKNSLRKAVDIIGSELPRWWRDINPRSVVVDDRGVMSDYYAGPRRSAVTSIPNPDITPADVLESAFNYSLGLPASLATYAGDTEAKGGAAVAGAVGKIKNALSAYAAKKAGSTVNDPLRVAFPGIYDNPREIVQSQRVAPESPLLQQLWGVTREDLRNIATSRAGNLADWSPPGLPANPRGSAHAERVMTKKNTQRISDILGESMQRKDLADGMLGWYVQDPMFRRMVEMFGPEEGAKRFKQLNEIEGMFSPGSDVMTELNRGSLAHRMIREGRFDDFKKYAGRARPDMPDFANVIGHPYHTTAHSLPVENYLRTGQIPNSDKVPSYIVAGQTPELGFQSHRPVGDAHWSRGVGLADVRGAQNYGASASKQEMVTLSPWFRDIASEHGLEAVPAQALQWGALANRTGVDTAIGAPKLELRALQIAKAAEREGVSPETMRDMYLAGQRQIGSIDPRLLWGGALVGGGYLGGKTLINKVNALKDENEAKKKEAIRKASE